MRWKGRKQSTRVEDRRGMKPAAKGGAALGGGAILLLVIYTLLTGEDPGQLAEVLTQNQASVQPGPSSQAPGSAGGAPQDELGQLAAVVLADTEETWPGLFRAMGAQYEPPTLVLFSDAVSSACGYNSAAVGPFYCPGDSKVYIDLGFFTELERRFGAPGDFAQAYVLAHEVGHHVQNQLGISAEVRRRQAAMSRSDANAMSVRVELQADCLAGVWAHHAHRERQLLEPGDVEEGLAAAAAIGDDNIQRQSRGYVSPESWTHGSSEQRVRWFRRGLESGDPDVCDTFSATTL